MRIERGFLRASALLFLECVVVGLSLRGGATDLPEELVPAARLESRSDNPARGAGIFGDHWWANRFLDRHRLVETYRGRVVDLVMIGDSITHRWEYMHTVSWAKFTSGRAVLNLGYGSDLTVPDGEDESLTLVAADGRAFV